MILRIEVIIQKEEILTEWALMNKKLQEENYKKVKNSPEIND